MRGEEMGGDERALQTAFTFCFIDFSLDQNCEIYRARTIQY